jgi:hypothetical protein
MSVPYSLNRKAIEVGLKAQGLDNVPAVGKFLKWSRGSRASDADDYVQARWEIINEVVDANGDPTDLPMAQADLEASLAGELMQRFKRKLVIVAAGKEALGSVIEKNNAKTAVVAAIGEVMIAGVIDDKEGYISLKLGYEPGADLVTAALRVGRKPFPVGLAAFIEEDKTVVRPDEMLIYAQNIPITELHNVAPLGTRFF